jgi:hypothetical protein
VWVTLVSGNAVACRRTALPEIPPGDAAVADTARGIIERVGADPLTSLVLRSTARGAIALIADDSVALGAARGLEVVITAAPPPRGGNTWRVHRFEVRAADGIAAMDGQLEREQSRWRLRRADGTLVPLPVVPASVAALVGARIYWVGPTDRAPVAYGVLRR